MEQQDDKKLKKKTALRELIRFSDIAFRMGATIGLGVWLGKWLDTKTGLTTPPVFLIVLSLLSIGAAIYMVIRDVDKK